MLNLVIAILSETFSSLASYQNGLYCDTLIKNFAHNEWHDQYGSLACAMTPLQVTYLLTVPALCFCNDIETVTARNEFIARFLYLPIAVVITAVFACCTAILAPISYLLHLRNLFFQILHKPDKACKNIKILVYFAIFGLPTLLFTAALDVPVFLFNLYTKPVEDNFGSRAAILGSFEKKNFMKFIESIDSVIEELKQEVRDCRKADKSYTHLMLDNGHHIIPFADYNVRLQDDMKIVAEITNLIFG
jgi:hypothetical protein